MINTLWFWWQVPITKGLTYRDLREMLMKRIFVSALHFRINTRYKVVTCENCITFAFNPRFLLFMKCIFSWMVELKSTIHLHRPGPQWFWERRMCSNHTYNYFWTEELAWRYKSCCSRGFFLFSVCLCILFACILHFHYHVFKNKYRNLGLCTI